MSAKLVIGPYPGAAFDDLLTAVLMRVGAELVDDESVFRTHVLIFVSKDEKTHRWYVSLAVLLPSIALEQRGDSKTTIKSNGEVLSLR